MTRRSIPPFVRLVYSLLWIQGVFLIVISSGPLIIGPFFSGWHVFPPAFVALLLGVSAIFVGKSMVNGSQRARLGVYLWTLVVLAGLTSMLWGAIHNGDDIFDYFLAFCFILFVVNVIVVGLVSHATVTQWLCDRDDTRR